MRLLEQTCQHLFRASSYEAYRPAPHALRSGVRVHRPISRRVLGGYLESGHARLSAVVGRGPTRPRKQAEGCSPARRKAVHRPSWSWVSVSSVVGFPQIRTPNGPDASTNHNGIQILAAETVPSSQDPYGAISGGYLDLLGRVQIATPRVIPAGPVGEWVVRTAGEEVLIEAFYPDGPWPEEEHDRDLAMLYIGRCSSLEW